MKAHIFAVLAMQTVSSITNAQVIEIKRPFPRAPTSIFMYNFLCAVYGEDEQYVEEWGRCPGYPKAGEQDSSDTAPATDNTTGTTVEVEDEQEQEEVDE